MMMCGTYERIGLLQYEDDRDKLRVIILTQDSAFKGQGHAHVLFK